jgi:hypothetical protein
MKNRTKKLKQVNQYKKVDLFHALADLLRFLECTWDHSRGNRHSVPSVNGDNRHNNLG